MGRKRRVSDEEFIRVAEGNFRDMTAQRLNISLRTVDRYAKRLGVKFTPDIKGRRRNWDRMTEFQWKTVYLRERLLEVIGNRHIAFVPRIEALNAIMEILGCCRDTAIKWHNFLLRL